MGLPAGVPHQMLPDRGDKGCGVRFGFPPEGFPTAGFETFALFPFLVCVEDFFVVDEELCGLDVV